MALRLGRLRLPWSSRESDDDPYWERFLQRPPADPQNSVVALIERAPDGAVNPVREEIHTPEINARHLKDLARFLGADLTGIVRLDPAADDNPESHPYAVVCAVRAEHDPRDTPGIGGEVPVQHGLFVTFVLSAYIRELGYRATRTLPAAGERLAAAAGLGTLDARGRLVTPEYGPRVHVAQVIHTDLPLAADG